MFAQLAKLRKCEGSSFRGIPPLGSRKPGISVREADPPWLLQTNGKSLYRLTAVVSADEQMLGNFVKPAEQRHSGQQHPITIDIAALRWNLPQSGHPRHTEDLIA